MATDRRCSLHVLVADVVVQSDSAVLLVRPRRAPDGAEGWRLPGDELRYGEPPAVGARRAVKDQSGLEPGELVLVDVESSASEQWRLTFHYRCDADRPPRAGGEVAEVRFFQVEHLPQTAHGDWERNVIYRVITGGSDLQ